MLSLLLEMKLPLLKTAGKGLLKRLTVKMV